MRNQPYEARLLISTLLDSPTIPGACRSWARKLGRDPMSLIALGAAPSWATKVAGLKRVMGGRAMTGDPWRLFPDSIRELIPLPPGDGAPKIRLAEFLRVMQSRPPLWLRAQGAEPEKLWDELRGMGLKPWVHRRMTGGRSCRRGGGCVSLAGLSERANWRSRIWPRRPWLWRATPSLASAGGTCARALAARRFTWRP